MHALTSATDLQHQLARQDNDVVCVKFTAKSCKPCSDIQPVLQQLASKHPHIHTYTADVNVPENKELLQIYGVQSMPTFLFFQNNESVYALKGANAQALTIAFEVADGMRAAQLRADHHRRRPMQH